MSENNNCEIEAIVSFDERGQLVIPKDLRKKFNLKAGDKFALISCMSSNDQSDCQTSSSSPGLSCCSSEDQEPALCCFTLINTKQLRSIVGQALNPVMTNIFSK